MAGHVNCAKMEEIRQLAEETLLEARAIRRQRDVSFYEDADLARETQRRIDALLTHLLAGHDGQPCPAGKRPIVQAIRN
jgi:hypothetical protein